MIPPSDQRCATLSRRALPAAALDDNARTTNPRPATQAGSPRRVQEAF